MVFISRWMPEHTGLKRTKNDFNSVNFIDTELNFGVADAETET